MKNFAIFLACTQLIVGCATAQTVEVETPGACKSVDVKGADFVVCRFAGTDDIRLFLNNTDGKPYSHFNWVNDALAKNGERLVFAMNAGMYHEDRTPVGFYRENGKDLASVNNNDGPGNFHLKPNGAFWLSADYGVSRAHVSATENFADATADKVVHFATQSGPMLVIEGELHPRFLPGSTSRKRRNGVGVDRAGDVWFVLADTPVTFHEFGSYFRDVLKTPNALYLDGTISRLYAPGLDRNDPGLAMGPIVGVVAKHPSGEENP